MEALGKTAFQIVLNGIPENKSDDFLFNNFGEGFLLYIRDNFLVESIIEIGRNNFQSFSDSYFLLALFKINSKVRLNDYSFILLPALKCFKGFWKDLFKAGIVNKESISVFFDYNQNKVKLDELNISKDFARKFNCFWQKERNMATVHADEYSFPMTVPEVVEREILTLRKYMIDLGHKLFTNYSKEENEIFKQLIDNEILHRFHPPTPTIPSETQN